MSSDQDSDATPPYTIPIAEFEELHATNLFSVAPESLGFERFVHHQGHDGESECTIYRRPLKTDPSLWEYFTRGLWANVRSESLYLSALDSEYRKSWDTWLVETRVIEEHREVEHLPPTQTVYWQSKMPWPLSNRDYLYARRGVKIDETFLLISRDVPHHPDAPEQKGVVRCEPCRQHMALREVDGKHTEFALQYADDLKGNIPHWLINKAAAKIIPSMIDQTHDRSQKYPPERAEVMRELHLREHTPGDSTPKGK